ncbi:unnamed protein product [Brachionus calyciflorus]|uniref:CX domain-containing protein n=1 Tax=Brachionus calyciflorus TaxID=104777 RepID=A0A813MUD4_9BILA|nr:unnamed protein product [Brachionus calyciflorus]
MLNQICKILIGIYLISNLIESIVCDHYLYFNIENKEKSIYDYDPLVKNFEQKDISLSDRFLLFFVRKDIEKQCKSYESFNITFGMSNKNITCSKQLCCNNGDNFHCCPLHNFGVFQFFSRLIDCIVAFFLIYGAYRAIKFVVELVMDEYHSSVDNGPENGATETDEAEGVKPRFSFLRNSKIYRRCFSRSCDQEFMGKVEEKNRSKSEGIVV